MITARLTAWDREEASIALLWLFHLSGIIGITIGFEDWFVTKTPLNLVVAFVLLIFNFPLDTLQKVLLSSLFFGAGMFVEWIGVHQGFLFGSYAYGDNLGPKLDGVPFLIGINWALLVLITGAIANAYGQTTLGKVIIGAALMVFLDFFLEYSAPVFDFWAFAGGMAPLQNYLTWFVIAGVLHFIFQLSKMQGSLRFSLHLYAAQLLFFFYFFGLIRMGILV